MVEHYVSIYDSYPGFNPSVLNVNLGDMIVWINFGYLDHTVTSNALLFNSGYMKPGDTFSLVFNEIGCYDYFCQEQRGWMFGKIIVV